MSDQAYFIFIRSFTGSHHLICFKQSRSFRLPTAIRRIRLFSLFRVFGISTAFFGINKDSCIANDGLDCTREWNTCIVRMQVDVLDE